MGQCMNANTEIKPLLRIAHVDGPYCLGVLLALIRKVYGVYVPSVAEWEKSYNVRVCYGPGISCTTIKESTNEY